LLRSQGDNEFTNVNTNEVVFSNVLKQIEIGVCFDPSVLGLKPESSCTNSGVTKKIADFYFSNNWISQFWILK